MGAWFDHAGLVQALNTERTARGLSWRKVALEAGLDPSTLQRIVAGSTPDLPRFAALVDWLELPADDFIPRDQQHKLDIVLELPRQRRIVLQIPNTPELSDATVQNLQRILVMLGRLVIERPEGSSTEEAGSPVGSGIDVKSYNAASEDTPPGD